MEKEATPVPQERLCHCGKPAEHFHDDKYCDGDCSAWACDNHAIEGA